MGVELALGHSRQTAARVGRDRRGPGWMAAAALLALTVAGGIGAAPGPAGGITEQQIIAADPGNWLTYNRTYDEQRFSPLDQINADSVGQLGLAWYADLDTARGQEATPLAIDGVLYTTTAWSMVRAYDGATGKLLWSYDPEVPRAKLVKACCDAVNRGLAAWGGKLYVGTLDGRLIALDRHTGQVAWTTATVPADSDYTITGAPRAVRGKIIIGNGGAEFSARGFVAAYDAETGRRVWKFYTVPGNPGKPFEQPELARAARTWSGRYWLQGGGGTVWDGITYDDKTGLLYFGTGNGEPWNSAVRDPGDGDNLFTASIVAVDPDTGKYAWHFQETPQDRWDFDSDAQITVADVTVAGQVRRVLMHAPKNGVFYMLDARTGAFIQGQPYTSVTWTTGLDPRTGKPKVAPEARYDRTGKLFIGRPGAGGAHSWMPMSFSPRTGLLYIPVTEAAFPYLAAKDWQPRPMGFNNGLDGVNTAMPAIPAVREAALKGTTGRLVAWDPVALKQVWSVAHPAAWNGGVLSTGGNLVFQGNAQGQFEAYRADTGQKLWSAPTQTGVIAGPMTFRGRDGAQYVAVMAGWGGVWALAPGILSLKGGAARNVSRLLVFRLGGTAQLPPVDPVKLPLDPPAPSATAQQVAEGAR
ncbi:MAG TPA: PQQ-dependent dehydrogenase, methanol/ethanol family, partial [Novosphingobium sp.]